MLYRHYFLTSVQYMQLGTFKQTMRDSN